MKDNKKRTPGGDFKRLDTFGNYTDGVNDDLDYDYDQLPFVKEIDLGNGVLVKYYGEISGKGIPNGKGKQVWENGCVYKGEFING